MTVVIFALRNVVTFTVLNFVHVKHTISMTVGGRLHASLSCRRIIIFA